MREQKHCLCYLVNTRSHISFAISTLDYSMFRLRLVYITIIYFMFYEMFLGLTLLLIEHNRITTVPGLLWYLKNIFIVMSSTFSLTSISQYLGINPS